MAADVTNVTCTTLAFGSAFSVTEAFATPAKPAAVFVIQAVPAVAAVASWGWEYLTYPLVMTKIAMAMENGNRNREFSPKNGDFP